ncbi:hypothetical protein [Mesorhizobium sp. 1B3]|uniref:hypothetical protein n=1 Tax=Mesorhizobium sp. 1B3 TaxID=3243599 RepID=UPI003D95FF32
MTLVKRHRTGYRLSELGETLIDYVLAIETAVGALERQVQAVKARPQGIDPPCLPVSEPLTSSWLRCAVGASFGVIETHIVGNEKVHARKA